MQVLSCDSLAPSSCRKWPELLIRALAREGEMKRCSLAHRSSRQAARESSFWHCMHEIYLWPTSSTHLVIIVHCLASMQASAEMTLGSLWNGRPLYSAAVAWDHQQSVKK